MRIVNAVLVLVVLSLPILWVGILSVSLYQAISAVYAHTDQVAFRAAYGE